MPRERAEEEADPYRFFEAVGLSLAPYQVLIEPTFIRDAHYKWGLHLGTILSNGFPRDQGRLYVTSCAIKALAAQGCHDGVIWLRKSADVLVCRHSNVITPRLCVLDILRNAGIPGIPKHFTATSDPAITDELTEVPWGACVALGDSGIKVLPPTIAQKTAALQGVDWKDYGALETAPMYAMRAGLVPFDDPDWIPKFLLAKLHLRAKDREAKACSNIEKLATDLSKDLEDVSGKVEAETTRFIAIRSQVDEGLKALKSLKGLVEACRQFPGAAKQELQAMAEAKAKAIDASANQQGVPSLGNTPPPQAAPPCDAVEDIPNLNLAKGVREILENVPVFVEGEGQEAAKRVPNRLLIKALKQQLFFMTTSSRWRLQMEPAPEWWPTTIPWEPKQVAFLSQADSIAALTAMRDHFLRPK